MALGSLVAAVKGRDPSDPATLDLQYTVLMGRQVGRFVPVHAADQMEQAAYDAAVTDTDRGPTDRLQLGSHPPGKNRVAFRLDSGWLEVPLVASSLVDAPAPGLA